jgi:hypothetical protein
LNFAARTRLAWRTLQAQQIRHQVFFLFFG